MIIIIVIVIIIIMIIRLAVHVVALGGERRRAVEGEAFIFILCFTVDFLCFIIICLLV